MSDFGSILPDSEGAVGGLPSPGSLAEGFTGVTGANAALAGAQLQAEAGREAIAGQREAALRGQEFFAPFAGVAERGVAESDFLANPQAQFDFLQENPLFKLALENANQKTLQRSSAGRRTSFGDTLQELSNNVLLSAPPLIDRQRQDIGGLIDLGAGIAGSQANIETGKAAGVGGLLTDIGAAEAAGGVGAANAGAAGAQNVATTGAAIASLFSDERLKENIKPDGTMMGRNWYTWDWNEIAESLGLSGSSSGVIAQENPDISIMDESGYLKVNYGAI